MIINSTKGVVDQGNKSAKMMQMQVFNSKFTEYEGKRTGAEVKQLINLVKTSNIVDLEHQIIITKSGFYDLINSKTYNVEIYFAGTFEENNLGTAAAGGILVGSGATYTNTENGYVNWIHIQA